MHAIRVISATLLILSSLSSSVRAAGCTDPILDQQQPNYSGLLHYVGEGFSKAQTFTVGLSGQLVEIRIRGWRVSGPIRVDLRRTVAGVPVEDDTGLFSTQIPYSDLPVWPGDVIVVDLSREQLRVEAGQQLAIALLADSLDHFGWQGNGGGPYPDGGIYYRSPTQPQWTRIVTGDLYFRTYVCPAPVAIRSESWGRLKALYR